MAWLCTCSMVWYVRTRVGIQVCAAYSVHDQMPQQVRPFDGFKRCHRVAAHPRLGWRARGETQTKLAVQVNHFYTGAVPAIGDVSIGTCDVIIWPGCSIRMLTGRPIGECN